MIWFITGGERSGKSRYAQEMALQLSGNPVYVATARAWDDDFKKRIARHRDERDGRWTCIEEEKHLGKLDLGSKVAVIDCVTLWLTNFYVDAKQDAGETLRQALAEFEKLMKTDCTLIVISNEIGMGVHAATESGRKFVELQGWMNQHIARAADKVVLMVSGIPVTIKG